MKSAEGNKEKRSSIRGHISAGHVSVAVVAIILLLGVFLPNVWEVRTISKNSYGPNEAWHSALIWMSDTDNTPDPFEDPDFYYGLYKAPPDGERYNYPESAYGVMAWYHRGFWITEIAHRIPNANPFGSGTWEAAQFFLAQDESSANEALDNLGSKYVIIDLDLVLLEYEAVAIKAGKNELQFREIYHERTYEGELKPKILYYPDYYQSMCARLYNFNAEAVIPHNSTTVISYDEITLRGELYKEITTTQSFATYEEAREYLESQTTPNFRIVGDDPFISPVPLEKLAHYKTIYQTEPTTVSWVDFPVNYVKIFEYLP